MLCVALAYAGAHKALACRALQAILHPQYTEGITNGVTNVNARAVLIQNNGGIITVNGVDDGMRVSAYSLSGVEEASAISRNGAAVLNTNAHTGSTVIVKMGEKSVKVLIK